MTILQKHFKINNKKKDKIISC